MKSHQLNNILNNKSLGSSELVQLLNNYFISIHENKSEISSDILLVKTKLGHFEAVSSYLKDLSSELKTGHGLLNFLRSHSSQQKEKVDIIFKKIFPRLKKLNKIITLSRSGTVLAVLKLWHQKNKKIKVIVCESRPKLEGRQMAESLVRNGIKTFLITDAMMSLFVPQVDAALIGADLVLKNGNVGIGTTAPGVELEVVGDAKVSGSLEIGANSLYIDADGTISDSDSQVIINDSAEITGLLTLKNDSSSSAAANRILSGTGADIALALNDTVQLMYDATSAKWRVIASLL
ncbi:MAG: translation initiation factor eIF-2B [Ignavibacteriaceae bacterium]|nr:translation initiation factor eIF-2B [Ignavibacteriaceae bacterium]